MNAIEKILNAVRNYKFYLDNNLSWIKVTVSIGYAGIEEELNYIKLLDLADKRLYAAKKVGKDRAVSE